MTDPITSVVAAAPLRGSAGGTSNPSAAVAAPPQHAGVAPVAAPDLHDLAAALNQRAQDLQTSLHFRVDQITGQLVISVIDTQDNQVLLQVPGQEALAVAQSLERMQMQLMKQSV
ncbi:flagellar protein FlaG [Nevskia soli]|uniref:flagellar protein FlaG n=1 Tax=Nevskia soli TaxID=418856 RepID=UPI00055B48A1|nr:flagellar protein FlaG [Nevskia soli]